jgi:hypothetical protein
MGFRNVGHSHPLLHHASLGSLQVELPQSCQSRSDFRPQQQENYTTILKALCHRVRPGGNHPSGRRSCTLPTAIQSLLLPIQRLEISHNNLHSFVFGCLFIISFALYERFLAPKTFIPYSLLMDRTVFGACILAAVLFLRDITRSSPILLVVSLKFHRVDIWRWAFGLRRVVVHI